MADNEQLTEKPGYYAVIPANIRYDKSLSPNAKLLYGEITCLLNFNNKCFASNKYFARLYEVSETQISRLINQLIKGKHITSEVENTQKGSRRLIRLALNINVNPGLTNNVNGGIDKNVNHNIHNTNNKLISEDINGDKTKRFSIPSLDAVKEYFIERGVPGAEHEKFYDFYTSKGWMVGKNKMKDWKSAVRNWLRGREAEQPKEEKQQKISL